MKIWFRVGMEADVTPEEINALASEDQKAHDLMQEIIGRAVLSGETYIVGQNAGGVEDYDNPKCEIDFLY